jgi:Tol biopolymer transport system component
VNIKLDKVSIFTLSIFLCACTASQKSTQVNNLETQKLVSYPNSALQKLLFVSNQDGDREIYTVEFNGGSLRQLTFNSRDDYEASWSPDGDKIVFTSNRDQGNSEVYLMNADGSEQVNLSQSKGFDGRASWSPDGASIVFTSDRDGAETLYLYSFKSSSIRPLSVAGIASAAEPVFSPDGQWIAFRGFNQQAKSDIWLVSIDGRDTQQLTHNEKSEDGRVSWSPDGRKLVYHSRRDHQYNLYIYDLDQQHEIQITNLPNLDVEPNWSHDGKHILFLSARGQLGRTQLCLMQEDGSQQHCLTDERYQIADARWLDDDSGILLINWQETRYSNVYLLDVHDGQLTVVSPANGYQSQPVPRPAVLPNTAPATGSFTASLADFRRNYE